MRTALLAVAALVAGPSLAVAAGPAAPPAAFVPGEVVVGFEDGAAPADRRAAVGRVDGRLAPGRVAEDVRVVRVPGGSPPAAARELEGAPGVDWAEPNYLYRASATPNDTHFGLQWGLLNTGQEVEGATGLPGADVAATPAWDVTTGSPGVRLAVVDSGIDAAHPDLAPNLARPANVGETGAGREANGVDDDGNGLVDDHRGWDWVADDNNPADEHPSGHGTHAAGIAAARGNDGIGVAGVAWQARLIALRGLNAAGMGAASDIAAAIAYANERGARVLNASLGAAALSQAIADAIADAPNMLVVAAAGNDGLDLDPGGVNEFPCEVAQPNVLCVAATDSSDARASFSNFGGAAVDLAAPGQSILSTTPGAMYSYADGTSFAAPFAAGAAALVLAANPAASTAQVRAALLAGAVPVAGLEVAAGRLDVASALASVPPAAPGPPVATGAATDVSAGGARLTGQVSGRAQRTSTYFEWGTTTAYGEQTATRSAGAISGAHPVADAVGGLAPGTTYHYRLVAADAGGISFGPDAAFTTAGGPAARPPAPAPSISVRRIGRAWFLVVRLGEPSTVGGRLQRRAVSARGRAGRFRGVRPLPARPLPAGESRIRLGRLRHGSYRVNVTIAGPSGRLAQSARFRAVVPLPVRARRAGGAVLVTVTLGRGAAVGARLERRRGRAYSLVRRFSQRRLPAGRSRIRLAAPTRAGSYRVRLVAVGGEGTRVGAAPFRVGV
jgi:subtilisin family serine protease